MTNLCVAWPDGIWTFSVPQFWRFLFDSSNSSNWREYHSLVAWWQLEKYNYFPIPPYKKHNFLLMKFIWPGPWSFMFNIVVNGPFFIADYYSPSSQFPSNCVELKQLGYQRSLVLLCCALHPPVPLLFCLHQLQLTFKSKLPERNF